MKANRFMDLALIALGAIISCWIAFYNKFPLVYPDTGTYIHRGFDIAVPVDRPIFYSLFLRHVSLAEVPFLVVFAQALICSYLIFLTLRWFYSTKYLPLVFLVSIVFLTLNTGYSYNVSILIPDIFSAVVVLSAINLLWNPKKRLLDKILLPLLFIFGFVTHLSNMPIITLMLIFSIMSLLVAKKLIRYKRQLIVFSSVLLLSIALVPTTNYIIDGRFRISDGSHVFMVSRAIELGILEPFLNESCDENDWLLCPYKDELAWNFIWSESSQLHTNGGWLATKENYSRMLSELYGSPKYWHLIIPAVIEGGFIQFFSFQAEEPQPQLKGSAPYGQIEGRFPRLLRSYISSKQNTASFDLLGIHLREYIVFFIALLVTLCILISAVWRDILPPHLKLILVLFLSYLLLNSFISSALSTVVDRYQNRVVWILPLLVICALPNLISQVKNKSLPQD